MELGKSMERGYFPRFYQIPMSVLLQYATGRLTKVCILSNNKNGKFILGNNTTLTTRPKWIIVYLGEMPQKR